MTSSSNGPETCPMCGQAANQWEVVVDHVYHGRPGDAVYRCHSCDVRFLYPGLSPEEEKEFYAKEFEKFMATRAGTEGGWLSPETHVRSNAGEVARRMAYLKDVLPPTGRVLEVGCSSGFLVSELARRGYDCVGVEPSGVFSTFVRESGFPCFDALEDLKNAPEAAAGVDVIMHYYVLEHIADAEGFLRDQLSLLRPGGVLIFEVPHANDALTAVYDIPEYKDFIWVISHQWYFSKRSMSYLLGKLGPSFEVRFDQRYDLSNHMTWARDGKPGGMGKFTDKIGAEVETLYKQALISAEFGDTLIGIVRKD